MFAKYGDKDCERDGSRNAVETAIDKSKDSDAKWDDSEECMEADKTTAVPFDISINRSTTAQDQIHDND